ncbi:MAG TPA: hypothetical protein VL171_01720 [Verrucomicrobiae bacterium]|nr:hypothetical protein [Verrucomicrobiae bacterium]
MADEKPIVGRTKHGELTLDQLAELQPGLGTLMRDVSDRYWIAYYAARGGNWELAAYQLRGLRSLFKKGNMTRPKYKGMIENYAEKILDPLDQHVAARNFAEFEKTYRTGIELANTMHAATDHAEIVWKLPDNPPPHLHLGPESST